MCSDDFIDFVLDENNLINKENTNNQEEISVVISEEIKNENLKKENLNNHLKIKKRLIWMIKKR